MSVKYRIRLQSDRVIGPFTPDEIGELYFKKHINGDEACQQFPIGDWKRISNFSNLLSLIEKIRKENVTSETHDLKSDKSNGINHDKTKSEVKSFNEFKFGKNIKIDVDYEELEKKYKVIQPDENKTRLINLGVLKAPIEVDKTIVIPSKASVPKKESTNTINNKLAEKNKIIEDVKVSVPTLTQEELMGEKTEFFNLAQVLPSLNAQLSISELELDQKARIEEKNEKHRLKKIQESIEEQGEYEDDEENEEDSDNEDQIIHQSPIKSLPHSKVIKKSRKKRKKGMSIIVTLTFIAIFYVLFFPDEKPKVTGPVFVDIKFPITQEFEDKASSSLALAQGRKLYSQNNYVKKVQASQLLMLSLQKHFSNNEAIGDLILAYTEL